MIKIVGLEIEIFRPILLLLNASRNVVQLRMINIIKKLVICLVQKIPRYGVTCKQISFYVPYIGDHFSRI